MIKFFQGSNAPIRLIFNEDMTDYAYIHILIYHKDGELMAFSKEDVMVVENSIYIPMKQSDTLLFPEGKAVLEIKGKTADGVVRFYQKCPINVYAREDEIILGEDNEYSEATSTDRVRVLDAETVIIKRGYSPFIDPDSHNWFAYDDEKKAFVDTGVYAEGHDGYTPIKGVDYYTEAETEQMARDVATGAKADFKADYDAKVGAFDRKAREFSDTAEVAIKDFDDNAVSKLIAYNENASAKISDYDGNAQRKLADYNSNDADKRYAYDANADARLSTYNSNAATKVKAYDDNATAKTGTFNDNATTKTSAYNTNADNKTSAYNSNADTKLSAYNTNATSRVSAYDANAVSKTKAYDDNASEKLAYYDEHVHEYEEEISGINSRLNTISDETSQLSESITDITEILYNTINVDVKDVITNNGRSDNASFSKVSLKGVSKLSVSTFSAVGRPIVTLYNGNNVVVSYFIGDATLLSNGMYFVDVDLSKHDADSFVCAYSSDVPHTNELWYKIVKQYTMSDVLSLVNKEENKLKGKTLLTFGDSICAGVDYQDINGNTIECKDYAEQIAENEEMNLVANFGEPGWTLAKGYTASNESIGMKIRSARLSGYTADYILLDGGTNDWFLNVPIGDTTPDFTLSTVDQSTMCGGLEYAFDQIYSMSPSAHKIFIIVHKAKEQWNTKNGIGKTMNDYMDACRKVCAKYSVKVVDLYNECSYNSAIVQGYTKPMVVGGVVQNYEDGTHPTTEGYKKFYVPLITSALKSLAD